MTATPDLDDLDLTDAELVEVLRNHGIDRRGLLKLLGAGGGVVSLAGTAAAGGGRDARIDSVFGATYSRGESPPPGLVDHEVELHVEPGDAAHEGFPVPDGPDPDDQDDVPEFHFAPVGLRVQPGDVVAFTNDNFEHTVTAFHEKWSNPEAEFPHRVPAGAPGYTSPPYVGGETWVYQFDTRGVHDLFCFPHLAFGMVMRVVVFDPRRDDLDDLTDWGPLPDIAPGPPDPLASAEQVLTDDALDPANVVSEGRIEWAELSL